MASFVLDCYKTLLQFTIPAVIIVSTVLGSMNALHAIEGEGTATNVLQFFVFLHIYFTLGLWFATLLIRLIKIRKIRNFLGQSGYENVRYIAGLISDAPRPLFWVILILSIVTARFASIFMPMVMVQTSAFFAQASFLNAIQ